MFPRPADTTTITAAEFSDLIRMIMQIDSKLDLILDELEIENGEAED